MFTLQVNSYRILALMCLDCDFLDWVNGADHAGPPIKIQQCNVRIMYDSKGRRYIMYMYLYLNSSSQRTFSLYLIDVE